MSDPSTDKTSPEGPEQGSGGGAPVRRGEGTAGKSQVTRVEKVEEKGAAPAKAKGRAPIPAEPRRDFFSDAMKEMLTPFAGLIEKRLQPLLNAIEAIPTQAEKWGEIDVEKAGRKALGGALDQLHARLPGKNVILPIAGGEKKVKRERRFLRPPGAMVGTGAEGANDFESICSRCGMCAEACPASAIKLDPNGLTVGGFPYIVAEEQPCVVCDELACMKSCPTGALKLVDRLEINMGTAKVDHATCLRDRGEPCTLCVDACPVVEGAEGNVNAIFASPMSGKIIVRKNICIGCGLCEAACPTEPRSVKVVPFEADREPIVA